MILLEMLQHEFIVRALLVGLCTAISAAILGNFVVAARQAVISDMLAHTALVGVGIGIVWQTSPTLWAMVSTLVSGYILWWLTRNQKQAPEAIAMLILTGGLALALLLAHLNRDHPIPLETYLFGSLLTITPNEAWIFIGLNVAVAVGIGCFWRPLTKLVFDQTFAQTQKNALWYELLLITLIALLVGSSLKVIGGLLIGGLLIIPALVVNSWTSSFLQNILGSVLVSAIAIAMGITISFVADVPTSSAIILSLVGLFVVSRIIRGLLQSF